MTRRPFATIALLAVVLTGCAQPVAAPTVSSTSPTASPTVPKPTPGGEPVPALAVSCGDLADAAALTTLYGSEIVERDPVAPSSGADPLIAVIQDGALICEWAPAGASEREWSLRLTVLADAAAGFAATRAALEAAPYSYQALDDPSMTLLAACRDGAEGRADCHWSATAGEVWIEAAFRSLPLGDVVVPEPRENPDTSLKPLQADLVSSASAEIVRGALSVAQASSTVPQPEPATARTCREVAPESRPEVAALGVPITDDPASVGSTSEYSTIAQWIVSAERQGITRCAVTTPDGVRLEILSVPNAAWLIGRVATDPTCYPDEGGAGCVGAAFAQGTMLVVSQTGSSDPALARALLAGMAAVVLPAG